MLVMQNFQIKLQESLKSKKNATIKEYKDSMQFRIKILSEKPDFIKSIMKLTFNASAKLESPEEIPALINAAIGIVISDLVFSEFELEDEDFH